MRDDRLGDQEYPTVTMGQAAELLGVQPAFLRSLDAADALRPQRSTGGHRRYSRRQLEYAARMRALFDQGLNLYAARRILELEDALDSAHRRIAELEHPGSYPPLDAALGLDRNASPVALRHRP
jgi:DNA-binding transcriptional MerR regulator